ncbi:MAG: serine kinase [Verrucomicrobia bacterium]|nr:serine kinase [Verrucomicrobiota bacterium]
MIEFLRVAHDLFERAAANAGGVREHVFEIAGLHLKLRFAGEAIVPHVLPALEHLSVPLHEDVSATIDLWDEASTGIVLPRPPWKETDYVIRGEIPGLCSREMHTAFDPGFRGLSMLHIAAGRGIFHLPDASLIPYYEHSSPLRSILHRWLEENRRQYMHAGAVGTENGGVLIAGKGGSGKSSTCLKCLCAGMLYAGDDYTVLDLDDIPRVHSLYCTAKLNAEDVVHFPELKGAVRNEETMDAEKALLFVRGFFPGNIVKALRLRAVLIPSVGHPGTEIVPLSPIAGLKALAPSTIFQLPGAGRRAFETLSALVKRVPCHALHLGPDRNEIPDVIRCFLEDVQQ